jgi:ABC-type branched-subunit amino acid transport system ATPase component
MALISTRALTKRYPGGVTALDRLSVEIGERVIGLVGANGAGILRTRSRRTTRFAVAYAWAGGSHTLAAPC